MNKTNNLLIILNILFLLYYSFQLLIYTDEFALKNLGSFNHAIAGLSEVVGIIFLSLAISLIFILGNAASTGGSGGLGVRPAKS